MASDDSKGILGHVPAPGIGLAEPAPPTTDGFVAQLRQRVAERDSLEERQVRALESIAASLEKLANPPVTVLLNTPTLVPDDK